MSEKVDIQCSIPQHSGLAQPTLVFLPIFNNGICNCSSLNIKITTVVDILDVASAIKDKQPKGNEMQAHTNQNRVLARTHLTRTDRLTHRTHATASHFELLMLRQHTHCASHFCESISIRISPRNSGKSRTRSRTLTALTSSIESKKFGLFLKSSRLSNFLNYHFSHVIACPLALTAIDYLVSLRCSEKALKNFSYVYFYRFIRSRKDKRNFCHFILDT